MEFLFRQVREVVGRMAGEVRETRKCDREFAFVDEFVVASDVLGFAERLRGCRAREISGAGKTRACEEDRPRFRQRRNGCGRRRRVQQGSAHRTEVMNLAARGLIATRALTSAGQTPSAVSA
jgi:hypothetical protein